MKERRKKSTAAGIMEFRDTMRQPVSRINLTASNHTILAYCCSMMM